MTAATDKHTSISSSTNATVISATIKRRHWLALKQRVDHGEISWLSGEGMIMSCTGNFSIGDKVSINIHANDHELKHIPAVIVRAEPAGKYTRYSLRFHKERLASSDGGLTSRLLVYLAQRFQA